MVSRRSLSSDRSDCRHGSKSTDVSARPVENSGCDCLSTPGRGNVRESAKVSERLMKNSGTGMMNSGHVTNLVRTKPTLAWLGRGRAKLRIPVPPGSTSVGLVRRPDPPGAEFAESATGGRRSDCTPYGPGSRMSLDLWSRVLYPPGERPNPLMGTRGTLRQVRTGFGPTDVHEVR